MNRYLKNASATYGIFALVLGLLAWLQLAASMTLLSAERTSSRPGACGRAASRCWPRSRAPRATRTRCASGPEIETRRSDQDVQVVFDHPGTGSDDADLEQYRAKRKPGKTPEPLEAATDAIEAAIRSSSCSATRRGGCTTTCGSSATASCSAGRSRGACRCAQASARSPCTSRITRSSTPTSRATSRRASTAGATVDLWDRGTYELVRERPDGTLTVILHGGGWRASGRSCRRTSTARSATG